MPTLTIDKNAFCNFRCGIGARPLLWAAVALWGVAIAGGFSFLASYKSSEGDAGSTPTQWPNHAGISAPVNRPMLLVFSHPHCPCTRAAFRELERAVSQSPDQVDVQVVFVGFDGANPQATSLASIAANWSFAKIVYDNGELGRRFGVRTSGHILLYNAQGQLQFSGGINSSRGHEGSSAGGAALSALLQNRVSDTTTAPVFGCPLFDSDRKCELLTSRDAHTGP